MHCTNCGAPVLPGQNCQACGAQQPSQAPSAGDDPNANPGAYEATGYGQAPPPDQPGYGQAAYPQGPGQTPYPPPTRRPPTARAVTASPPTVRHLTGRAVMVPRATRSPILSAGTRPTRLPPRQTALLSHPLCAQSWGFVAGSEVYWGSSSGSSRGARSSDRAGPKKAVALHWLG